MKEVPALRTHARIAIHRCIEPAIGRDYVQTRVNTMAFFIHDVDANAVHRCLPLLRVNRNGLLATSVRLHDDQTRKSALVGDVSDALAIW